MKKNKITIGLCIAICIVVFGMIEIVQYNANIDVSPIDIDEERRLYMENENGKDEVAYGECSPEEVEQVTRKVRNAEKIVEELNSSSL
jgi:hypothetical protein